MDELKGAVSLAEALPKEIDRVRGIQETYKQLRDTPGVMVEPQIQIMEAEIQAAVRACAEGDVAEMARRYKSLQDYEA